MLAHGVPCVKGACARRVTFPSPHFRGESLRATMRGTVTGPDVTVPTFREEFMAVLDAKAMSLRKLSHLLADIDGRKPESHRRALQKYVQEEGPTVPGDAAVAKIVLALDLRADHFATALASARRDAQGEARRRSQLEVRVAGVEDGLRELREQIESLRQAVRVRGARPHSSGGGS